MPIYDPSDEWDAYCQAEERALRGAIELGESFQCPLCNEYFWNEAGVECSQCGDTVCKDCATVDEDTDKWVCAVCNEANELQEIRGGK